MSKKVIVIGAGKLGKRWIDYILEEEGWEICGIVETSEKVKEEIKQNKKIRGIPIYNDIDEVNENVDGCIISTPPESHLDIAKKAILKNINILCEKPLTFDFDKIDEILKLKNERDVVFLVNQNQRSIPQLKVLKEFIKSGRLGRICYISIYFSRIMRTYDWREEISQPVLIDMSIHHFDDIRYVIEKELGKVISCFTFNPEYSFYKGDSCVSISMVFDNIFVDYYATWIGKGIQTDWTGYWTIEGENGVLYLKDCKVFFVYGKDTPLDSDKIEYLNIPKEEFKDSLLWTLDKFKKAIEKNMDEEVKGITIEENIKSLKILEESLKFLKRRKDERDR
ncbi:MAG: Gfo/Idh/MocA family oxidoreductase [Candidatus Omnitrophica bacterium]|nr:Gfo/Idh/MocA family oxidoreductase [Candidatus Omnitrophota bacterium]